jgi:hypothetical protein
METPGLDLAGLVSAADDRPGAPIHGLAHRRPVRRAPLAIPLHALRRPVAELGDTLANPSHEVSLRHHVESAGIPCRVASLG